MGSGGRILLVSDDNESVRIISEELVSEGGYIISCESSYSAVMNTFERDTFDLVMIQFKNHTGESEELADKIRKVDPSCVIIAILEESDTELVKKLFRLGVYDFMVKPLKSGNFKLLIKKGFELHTLLSSHIKLMEGLKERNESLEKQNSLLTKRIEDSSKNLTRLYKDLRSTYMRTIKALAQAIDARDHYTHSHSEDVAKYAVAISKELGLSVRETETIREACELHDLGKIGVEDSILTKPTSLTEEEWVQIRKHPTIGANILEPLTFLSDVIELVRQHHERYDGAGYPAGRKGEDILMGARIINLADAYEAMRSARSYRKNPFSKEEAILEIKRNSGKQFDPNVVVAFLNIVDKL